MGYSSIWIRFERRGYFPLACQLAWMSTLHYHASLWWSWHPPTKPSYLDQRCPTRLRLLSWSCWTFLHHYRFKSSSNLFHQFLFLLVPSRFLRLVWWLTHIYHPMVSNSILIRSQLGAPILFSLQSIWHISKSPEYLILRTLTAWILQWSLRSYSNPVC